MKMSSQGIKAYNWTFISNEGINLNRNDNNLQYIIGRTEFPWSQGFIQLKCKGDENDIKRIIGKNNVKVTTILTSPEQIIEQLNVMEIHSPYRECMNLEHSKLKIQMVQEALMRFLKMH